MLYKHKSISTTMKKPIYCSMFLIFSTWIGERQDFPIKHHNNRSITKVNIGYTIMSAASKSNIIDWSLVFQSLRSATLQAARWTLVLLYVLSFSGCYLHTLPVKPPLTDVAANPELIGIVVSPTAATECFTMLFFIFFIAFISQLWGAFHLTIVGPLQNKRQE